MKVKSESEVAQSCLTPSDPMDCSLPGSSIHGIFQARVLEWGAIAFSGTNPQLTSYSLVKAEHFKNALWSFLFNKVLEVQPEQTGKKKKSIKIANTEVKLSLFSDDMMLYIQTLKNLQKIKDKKQLLGLVTNLIKFRTTKSKYKNFNCVSIH